MSDPGESRKSRPPTTLRVCVYIGLLSLPFWFLIARFPRELDAGPMPPPNPQNPGTPQAILYSLLFGAATFGLAVFTLRKEIWKR